ncbi:MAG TPA: ectoine/hydroxyectoine ABC transporter substrate-binding protein EhuB [Candidatus Sulfomarinibacteraceae bacterium]|nr:ectoine/hydroxyectoine ABC transporter substrate-binding protein EhuB [Candidatus Sulfomarinibacteraceae bacterium]
MNLRKLLTLLLVLVALTALTVACQPANGGGEAPADTDTSAEETTGDDEDAGESTLERARREGVIRVGFANENPYAFAQPDGTLSGEAVEVARAVFQELGIEEMEGVLTQFGSLIPGLQAGRFDVITAGMYITPTRCEQVLFADPEYQVGEALIVEAGNPLNLHSYEDIAANPDVRVGTGAGYLEIDYMLEAGVSEDQIVEFPDDPSGVAGLQAGQIDAWTGTRPTLLITLETTNDPNIELADPFEQPTIDGEPVISYGGAAFRYEDLEFREAFNEELQNLKDSGQLLDLIGQFEGFDEAALPGDTTAEDICPDAYSDLQ